MPKKIKFIEKYWLDYGVTQVTRKEALKAGNYVLEAVEPKNGTPQ